MKTLGMSDLDEESPKEQPVEVAETESEEAEDETEETETEDGNVFIPSAALGGKSFKAGDSITMKVVGVSEDGLQVEYAKPSEEDYPSAETQIDEMMA